MDGLKSLEPSIRIGHAETACWLLVGVECGEFVERTTTATVALSDLWTKGLIPCNSGSVVAGPGVYDPDEPGIGHWVER